MIDQQGEYRATKCMGFARALAVALLLVAGLLIRLGLAEYFIRHVEEKLPDTSLYVAYAECLFHGRPYQIDGYHALRSPGYPAYIAACWFFGGEDNSRGVLWGQALLGVGTALVVYAIGRSFEKSGLPRGLAIVAMTVFLFEPYGLLTGALELSESLFTFLFAVSVWIAVSWSRRPSLLTATLLGLVAGAGVLVRPSVLLLLPLGALGVLIGSHDRAKAALLTGVALVALVVVLAPWTIRNIRVIGRPIVTTLNVGESLYDGLNPQADGGSRFWFKDGSDEIPTGEIEQDDYWRRRAIAWAADHPAGVLELALVKLGRFWSPWPNESRYRTPLIATATTLYTIPLYLLAGIGIVAGFWVGGPARQLALFSLVPIAYFCGLHMIFVSSVRYRVVVVPLLSLAAGWGWSWINHRRDSDLHRQVAFASV